MRSLRISPHAGSVLPCHAELRQCKFAVFPLLWDCFHSFYFLPIFLLRISYYCGHTAPPIRHEINVQNNSSSEPHLHRECEPGLPSHHFVRAVCSAGPPPSSLKARIHTRSSPWPERLRDMAPAYFPTLANLSPLHSPRPDHMRLFSVPKHIQPSSQPTAYVPTLSAWKSSSLKSSYHWPLLIHLVSAQLPPAREMLSGGPVRSCHPITIS